MPRLLRYKMEGPLLDRGDAWARLPPICRPPSRRRWTRRLHGPFLQRLAFVVDPNLFCDTR
eukprot:4346548-Pyramimonas_sp.AAC.1